MSGPKKWASKVVGVGHHRKTSSRSNISSDISGEIDEGNGLFNPFHPPPPRLPNDAATSTTATTAMLAFGSGSTLVTRGDCTPPGYGGGGGGAYNTTTEWSDSSLDSGSVGRGTPSPSTTPPKKSWELNYKSFLKRKSGGSSGTNAHQTTNKTTASSSNHSKSSTSTSIFHRVKSANKSLDNLNLDATLRRGVDSRKSSPTTSPNGTPPGSSSSTPRKKLSPLIPAVATSTSMMMMGGHHESTIDTEIRKRVSSQPGGGVGNNVNDSNYYYSSLDQPRHGRVSSGKSSTTSYARTRSTCGPPPKANPTTLGLFSKAQSVATMVATNEGGGQDEGGGELLQLQITNNSSDEEQYLREQRKVFTDLHNSGNDSTSAYLGDESSLHRNSVFLSSMAYPAGSAGGKAHSRSTFNGIARSLDHKRTQVSPSTSLNSISEVETKDVELLPEPERSLCSLKGPEHWTKGDRHVILPGVLCMCPIQVLNHILSTEDGYPQQQQQQHQQQHQQQRPSSLTMTIGNIGGSSPLRRSFSSGFGIGSIIQDDNNNNSGDSNGWFFADQPSLTPVGSGSSCSSSSSSNVSTSSSAFDKIKLGKATVAPIGMRSFLNELYGWCTGVFILRHNYLFEYRECDSHNSLPWGYAHLPYAEAYPHKHFMNALHLDFYERPCYKSGRRSLLLRVESKTERDRWVSLLQAASRMTMHDLYEFDDSEGAHVFGEGRYAVVRPARRRERQQMAMSFSSTRLLAASHESLWNVPSSNDGLGGVGMNYKSITDLGGTTVVDYQCALKIIDKKEFWQRVKKGCERTDTLVREAAVQTTLAVLGAETSGFLRLLNIFETAEHLVLELELLEGTDLFQHVSSRGNLDEVEAAHIMRDLLNCLYVLDQIGIAHRDIKPANLLMCHSDGNSNNTKIKLADYGMASFVGVDNLVRGRCGTPGFVAPEILLTGVNGGYCNKSDMFSAGVTLYVMLAGYEPFYGESDAELIKANREAKVVFPHKDWHNVSIEGRDLLEKMLVTDPAKRISPIEALRHPWITRRAPQPIDSMSNIGSTYEVAIKD